MILKELKDWLDLEEGRRKSGDESRWRAKGKGGLCYDPAHNYSLRYNAVLYFYDVLYDCHSMKVQSKVCPLKVEQLNSWVVTELKPKLIIPYSASVHTIWKSLDIRQITMKHNFGYLMSTWQKDGKFLFASQIVRGFSTFTDCVVSMKACIFVDRTLWGAIILKR